MAQGDPDVRVFGGVADEGGRYEEGSCRQEGVGVLGGKPVGADRLEVGPVEPVAGGEVVADGVGGDVRHRVLGGDVLARPADDEGEFEFPVVLLTERGQLDVVVRAADRAGRAEEDVRDAAADPLVHHPLGVRAGLLGRGAVHALLLGGDQVHHVLAVVGAALQDLAGLDGGEDAQVGEGVPGVGGLLGKVDQAREEGLPVLDDRAHGQGQVGQVTYPGPDDQAREDPGAVPEGAEGEGSGVGGESVGHGRSPRTAGGLPSTLGSAGAGRKWRSAMPAIRGPEAV